MTDCIIFTVQIPIAIWLPAKSFKWKYFIPSRAGKSTEQENMARLQYSVVTWQFGKVCRTLNQRHKSTFTAGVSLIQYVTFKPSHLIFYLITLRILDEDKFCSSLLSFPFPFSC